MNSRAQSSFSWYSGSVLKSHVIAGSSRRGSPAATVGWQPGSALTADCQNHVLPRKNTTLDAAFSRRCATSASTATLSEARFQDFGTVCWTTAWAEGLWG